MNIWLKYASKTIIVAPLNKTQKSAIDIAYEHSEISFRQINDFNITSIKNLFKAMLSIPLIVVTIYRAMEEADHIHLRCPGNMGLLGCMVQILFPKKRKTAKYAGNWDPKAKQPLTYRLQKWILGNTFLTRNMQVLVYGEWENQTKNIKPFFTATYSEDECKEEGATKKNFGLFRFLFVGTLSEGKNPLYAIRIVEGLHKEGVNVQLEICGEGKLRSLLETYINEKELESFVFLKGNLTKEEIKEKYQHSHFLILPSKSEGWPKVVAEAMFWGSIPIASAVSCVANMIDNGERGILLDFDLKKDMEVIEELMHDRKMYATKSRNALSWSRTYTTERFEKEIKKMLHAPNSKTTK